MKRILTMLILLIAGLGVGGGAAWGTAQLLGPAKPVEKAEPDPVFVPSGKVLAPLVFPDGRLSGYVSVQMQLEVPADKVEFVTARLPLLLHAINMRTYRTPLAAGPDGMLPNLDGFRKVVMQAAPEAFGAPILRRVAITEATPA